MTVEAKNQNPIEDLIVGHFDGSLTGEQEKELAEALATSTEAKRIFLSYMRMEGRLHSLGRDGFLRKPGVATQEAPQPADTAAAAQNGSEPVAPARLVVWAASTSLAICVALMLGWAMWPTPVSANSVLQKAQQVAAKMIDRTYRMSESRPNAEGSLTTRELMITVRGEGRFVVQSEQGDYVMGNDGSDYWMARRKGPVFVTGDFRKLAPELQRQIPNRRLLIDVLASPDEPLLLCISDLLLLIERRYDIELVDSKTPIEHHVRATRRSDVRGRPSIINLHADAETGVVLKAELHFADSRKRNWELIETSTLSERWYHHSEHAPGRPVKRLDAATD